MQNGHSRAYVKEDVLFVNTFENAFQNCTPLL